MTISKQREQNQIYVNIHKNMSAWTKINKYNKKKPPKNKTLSSYKMAELWVKQKYTINLIKM